MSNRRYIPQTPNNDFIYPNNDRVEYDVTISHPVNDNCPTGSVSGLTLTVNSGGTSLDIDYDYTFDQNGSIPFYRGSGNHGYISVHMMTPDQDYLKPWRMVDSISSSTPADTYSGSRSITVSASDFGVSDFPGGTYTFEFRLISEDCVTVICDSYEVPVWTGCTCYSYDVTNTSSESLLTVQYKDCYTGFVELIDVDPSSAISLCACQGTAIVFSGTGTIVENSLCTTPLPTATPTATGTTPTPTPSPTATPSCSLTTIPDTAFIAVGSDPGYTSLGGYCITDEFSQDYGEFFINTGSTYIPDVYAWEGAAGSTTCYTPTSPYGTQVSSFSYNGGTLYPTGSNTLYDSGVTYSYGGCTYDVVTEWTGPACVYVHLCPQ